MKSRSALLVQFGSLHAYPPIWWAANVLVAKNWRVSICALARSSQRAEDLPLSTDVRVRTIPTPKGRLSCRVRYLGFLLTSLRMVAVERPSLVYCYDAGAAPVGLIAKILFRRKVIYHEHDALALETNSWVARIRGSWRTTLARRADLVVVPAKGRARLLPDGTPEHRIRVVWNCPLPDEEGGERSLPPSPPLRLVFQGSLSPCRLPLSLLEALSLVPGVELWLIGAAYSQEARMHERRFKQLAEEAGVRSRIVWFGERPWSETQTISSQCHVGLSFASENSDDPNMRSMAGASNKTFEYLKLGLCVMYHDTPSWRDLLEASGAAIGVDMHDPGSIASGIRRLSESPEELDRMSQRGPAMIRSNWNYSTLFGHVVDLL